MSRPKFLFDTNAVIESVRTGIWNALTGSLMMETVATCVAECRAGDRLSSGYLQVSDEDLNRFSTIHAVGPNAIAELLVRKKSGSLHDGERDLFAHALSLPGEEVWLVCSPDKASVAFAVSVGYGDRLISLEEAAMRAGARPNPSLRSQFTTQWLSRERTKATLGV